MAGFIRETTPKATPIVQTDFRHSLCRGETGCGKTTSFMLPNIQDRIQKNYGMLIVDVKGNLHSHVKAIATRENRLKDVLEIGVPWGSKINIFANISRSLFVDTLSEINGNTKDDFWISSALNIAGIIYDVFAIYKNLKSLTRGKINLSFDAQFDVETINRILSSFVSFAKFIKDCEKVANLLNIKNIAKLKKINMSENDIYLIRQFAQEFSVSYTKLFDFYKEIDKDNPAAGNGGVFFVLRSIMHMFIQNGFDGIIELKELLEGGKIVVLHAETYDESLFLALMNILYKRLLIRNNQKPITLFLDEFQRSVSKRNIPYIDLFREMNVEVIAAMQNIQQLENKIGERRCDEFLGNILHNYEYANHRENSLDTFEFVYKNKKSLAIPIFINNKEKVLAQMKWQNVSEKSLPLGWIYVRPEGYKRAIFVNIRTKKLKYYFILDKKDNLLTRELENIKNGIRTINNLT